MVPPVYWPTLAVLASVLLVVRAVRRRPLVPALATPAGAVSLAIAGISAIALAFHCTAMFFPRPVDSIQLLASPAMTVRMLGTGSKVAYAAPAALLVAAFRRVWWPMLVGLAVALLAVGSTMYRWIGLSAHLAAIAAAIVLGAIVVAGFVGRRPDGLAARPVPGSA